MTRIVAISDVHNRWKNLVIPECDVLISAGDYSFHGEPGVIKSFHAWLNEQPAKHIISVQGNHEEWVEKHFDEARAIAEMACPRVHFIEEDEVTIDGVHFWGSAITPWFHDWAYNRHRGDEIDDHWKLIPDDTDILITHGPPYGILDIVPYANGTPKERVGCWNLKARIKQVKPDIHIFGHVHHSYGHVQEDGVDYYNVAVCDETYTPTNAVTYITYESDGSSEKN